MLHQMMRRVPALLLLVMCAGLLVLVVRTPTFSERTCGLLPFGHDYFCFAKSLDNIYEREGSQTAFEYLNTISDDLNYGASHLIAHQLGHSLWDDARDLQIALAHVPYGEYSPTEIFRYGGVVHGIFHSYFLFNTEQDVHVLIAQSCTNLASEGMSALQADCVHGIGHGLMAYTNNDIQQTLTLCEETLQPVNCYQGAFMEHGLLHIPGYADTAKLQELSEVCVTLTPVQSEVCAQYVGWTAIVKDLVQKRSSQTAVALHVCDTYADQLRHDCIFVAVRDLFSIVYENDQEAMTTACAELTDAAACLEGIAAWSAWEEAYKG